MKKHLFVMLLAVCTALPVCARMSEELLLGGNFTPTYHLGEATGIYAWTFCDFGRLYFERNARFRNYLDGRKCFKLEFPAGKGVIINFKKDAPKGYYGKESVIYNLSNADVPASGYRLQAEMRFNSGVVRFSHGKRYKGTGKLIKVDQVVKLDSSRYFGFYVNPAPGMKLELRKFSVVPVYPVKAGGSIALPGKGRLTGIVVPENPSNALRFKILEWRGWLWKITGTLLPLVSEKDAAGKSGMLRFTHDSKLAVNGTKVKVDKNGFAISYNQPFGLRIAMFRYLHRCGLRYYNEEIFSIPKCDPKRILPAVAENFTPVMEDYLCHFPGVKFLRYNGSRYHWGYLAGGQSNWYYNAWSMIDIHCGNFLLPQEKFFDKHPEYYMTHADGKQHKEKFPHHVTPCLSHPEGVKHALGAMKRWIKYNDYSTCLHFILGDKPLFCQCERCKKASPDDSYSNVYMNFMNECAKLLPDDAKGQKMMSYAYLKTFNAPDNLKPDKNLHAWLCIAPFSVPCHAHLDCEMNRKSWEQVKKWAKLFPPEKISLSFYEEVVPLLYEERIQFLSKYAKGALHCYSGYEYYAHYFGARFVQGDKPEDIRNDYAKNCFGKGAKNVLAAWQIIYDFCKNYKHVPADYQDRFSVLPWVYYRRGILTREVFDAVYAEFDKALAVVKDPAQRRAILFEQFKIMRGDLAKYSRGTCVTKAELLAFSKRFAKFLRICDEILKSKTRPYNILHRHIMYIGSYNSGVAEYLQACAGINISGKAKPWTKEPELQKFLAAPEKYFSSTIRESGFGWDVPPYAMLGGIGAKKYDYKCPERMMNAIHRPSSGKHQLVIPFEITRKITSPMVMLLEGLDDDKPGKTTFRITVNGKEIFSGVNTFPEDSWGTMKFTIPAELLKVGENSIAIINTTADREDRMVKGSADGIFMGDSKIQSYFWGWLGVSGVRLLPFTDLFRRSLAGEKTPWERLPRKHAGKAVFENGKLNLETNASQKDTGVSFRINGKPIPAGAGCKLKYTVTAQGKGAVIAGFWAYSDKGKYLRGKQHKAMSFRLDGNSRTITRELPVEPGVYKFIPYIQTGANSDIKITDFRIE